MCVEEYFVEVFVSIPVWYLILLILAFVAAILSRSLILCIGVILMCVVAMAMMYEVDGISAFVRYGLVAVWLAMCGAMVFQIIFSVRRI